MKATYSGFEGSYALDCYAFNRKHFLLLIKLLDFQTQVILEPRESP